MLGPSDEELSQLADKIAAALVEKLSDRLQKGDLPVPQEYMSPRQVAQMTGIPIRSLEAMRGTRAGPKYYKIAKRVRYKVQDVRDYIEAGGPV